MEETWASPPGLEDYSVSTAGNIQRIKTVRGGKVGSIKPTMTRGGLCVRLPNVPNAMLPQCRNCSARYTNIAVARLMLYTFVGSPPHPFSEVGYADGDKSHIELTNISWTRWPETRKYLEARRGRNRQD